MIFSEDILKQTLLALSIEQQESLLAELESKDHDFLNYEQQFGTQKMIDILTEQLSEYDNEVSARNIIDED